MSHSSYSRGAAVLAGLPALCLLLLAGCSGNGDPYSYVKVSGKVTYEDGSLIPAKLLMLGFISEAEAVGKQHARMGSVIVDSKTGEFRDVTSHTPHDGLVRGKHKVTVAGEDHHPLPKDIVPPEYGDPKNTPLEIDTDHLPLIIKIPKPQPEP